MKLLVLAGQLPAKFAVRKVTLPCAEPSIAKIRFHSSVYQTHIPQTALAVAAEITAHDSGITIFTTTSWRS